MKSAEISGLLADYYNTWSNAFACIQLFQGRKLKTILKRFPVETVEQYIKRKSEVEVHPDSVAFRDSVAKAFRKEAKKIPDKIRKINALVIQANQVDSIEDFQSLHVQVRLLIYGVTS